LSYIALPLLSLSLAHNTSGAQGSDEQHLVLLGHDQKESRKECPLNPPTSTAWNWEDRRDFRVHTEIIDQVRVLGALETKDGVLFDDTLRIPKVQQLRNTAGGGGAIGFGVGGGQDTTAVDMRRLYQESGGNQEEDCNKKQPQPTGFRSYKAVRDRVQAMYDDSEKRRRQELEGMESEQQVLDYWRVFLEKQFHTTGIPALNNHAKLMERRQAEAKSKFLEEKGGPLNQDYGIAPAVDVQVAEAIRNCLRTGRFDMSGRELLEFPRQMYQTLILALSVVVKSIYIADNHIEKIPPQVFHHMRSLETLVLRGNNLESLSNDLINMTQLTSLNCDSNSLFSTPAKFPRTLLHMSLGQNQLREFPNCARLAMLAVVDVRCNNIVFLRRHLKSLKSVHTLNVSRNSLFTLAFMPEPMGEVYDPEDDDEDADPSSPEELAAAALRQTIADAWTIMDNRTLGEGILYYNSITGDIERIDPRTKSSDNGPSTVTGGVRPNSSSVPNLDLSLTHANATTNTLSAQQQPPERASQFLDDGPTVVGYNKAKRRQWLKDNGKAEWDAASKGPTIIFYDNVNQLQFSEMPLVLDRLGELTTLTKLTLTKNKVTEFPPSLEKLWCLKILEIDYNRIWSIPDYIGNMTSLRTLSCAGNRLTLLPDTICTLPKLTALDIKVNNITELPFYFGNITTLTKLNASSNSIERLPPTTPQLKRLTEFLLLDNPCYTNVMKLGVKAIFKDCMERLAREKYGLPPQPVAFKIGIGDQCDTTTIHRRKAFKKAISDAVGGVKSTDGGIHSISVGTGACDFHWKKINHEDIPEEPFNDAAAENLEELRLMGHCLDHVPREIVRLRHLKLLNMSNNSLAEVDEKCFKDTCALRHISLVNNLITTLPTSMLFATALTELDLTNNQIEALPKLFGRFQNLKRLDLAHNYLSALPATMAEIKGIEFINLGHNRISELPPVFGSMSCLRYLNLNLNQLRDLPENLGIISLRVLELAGNLFTTIPDALAGPMISTSLTRLNLYKNEMRELPVIFTALVSLHEVQLEGNPMRSPPPDVVEEGLASIARYIHTRFRRLQEMRALLDAAMLHWDRGRLSPHTQKLIVGDTGFLTPTDLTNFDKAVDNYVNAQFYLYPETQRGCDIVVDFLELTEQRAQDERLKRILTLIRIIELSERSGWLDKRFLKRLHRNWGENGKSVQLLSIQLPPCHRNHHASL
jgi:Leucine-rich repeat (LRR) protein